VLFPKTGHSFRITSPQDQDLISAALSTDRFITVVLLKETEKPVSGDPPIHEIGTLSYIFEMNKDKAGVPVVSVIGLEKVMINEAVHELSYRTGAMTIIKDVDSLPSQESQRKKLIDTFSEFLHVSRAEMETTLLHNPLINNEMLTNIVSSLIPIPVSERQKLLELPDIGLRLEVVCQYLEKEIAAENPASPLKDALPLPPDWN
jgi:Lon protease-like protein